MPDHSLEEIRKWKALIYGPNIGCGNKVDGWYVDIILVICSLIPQLFEGSFSLVVDSHSSIPFFFFFFFFFF